MTTQPRYQFGRGAVAALGFIPERDGKGVAFCAGVERAKAEGKKGEEVVIGVCKANPGAHQAYLEAIADATRYRNARVRAGPNAAAFCNRVVEIAGATGADVFACLGAISRLDPTLWRDGIAEIQKWRAEQ